MPSAKTWARLAGRRRNSEKKTVKDWGCYWAASCSSHKSEEATRLRLLVLQRHLMISPLYGHFIGPKDLLSLIQLLSKKLLINGTYRHLL